MNSTNVRSNQKNNEGINNPAPVMGQTIPTKEGIDMPPKAAKCGISADELKKFKNEEVIIFSVGKSKLNGNNTLETEDGKVIAMKNSNAYKDLMAEKKNRLAMKEKALQKVNSKNNNKAQAGMEAR